MMRCAKCTGPLRRETHKGLEIDRCPQCGGIFLDDGELKRVVTDGDSFTVPEDPWHAIPQSDAFRASCPKCAEPMNRFRTRLGFAIDLCSKCRGLWLDRGELTAIDEKQDMGSPFDRRALLLAKLRREIEESRAEKAKEEAALRQKMQELKMSGVLTESEVREMIRSLDREKPAPTVDPLLASLQALRNRGLLSEEAFQRKKRALLEPPHDA